MADVEDLVYELRAPEGEPAGAIVLLHGRGTSEQDCSSPGSPACPWRSRTACSIR